MLKYYDMRFEDTLTKNKTEVLEIATEIFEIAENHGLNNWIYPPAGKALPENICRYLTKQIVSVVKAMHDKNLAHRDIKPENFLLDAKFNIKICDFNLTQPNGKFKEKDLGTDGFISPEQILAFAKPYDGKIGDIFAVGVSLFLMMAGYHPFESARKTDQFFKCLF